MHCRIEALFTPAEFRILQERDLSRTICVVFDILRATSTIVAALGAGAAGVFPVGEIGEALASRTKFPGPLLAGERAGLRITAAWAGGVDFDLGNSPREFTPDKVRGKIIVMTTTNGTRALQACSGAAQIVAGSFLNLSATIRFLRAQAPEHICLVCAGTGADAALEDALAAGAFCDRLISDIGAVHVEDSARIVLGAFREAGAGLAHVLGQARNARRLLSLPELRDDVQFCIQHDAFDFAVTSRPDGLLTRVA